MISVPFQIGGRVRPKDPSFSGGPYLQPQKNALIVEGVLNFRPFVVCSPRLSGKSTAVQYILSVHRRIDPAAKFFEIEIPAKDEKLGWAEARLFLREALGIKEDFATVVEYLENSPILLGVGERKLLSISNVEHLADDVLRWFLRGIKTLSASNQGFVGRTMLHVVLEGSVAVDTLSAGPVSDIPLDYIYPGEFDSTEQRAFLENMFAGIYLKLSGPAFERFWSLSDGDKYLSQALGLKLVERSGFPSEEALINEDDVTSAVNEYLSEATLDPLLRAGVLALKEIDNMEGIDIESVPSILQDLELQWSRLPPLVRNTLYRGGLVRQDNDGGLRRRAPIMQRFVADSIRRLLDTRALIDLYVPWDGVRRSKRQVYDDLRRRIEYSAIEGVLSTLHLGWATPTDRRGKVAVEAYALGLGDYVAEIDMTFPREENGAWFILWRIEDQPGHSVGECQLLPATKAGEDD